MSRESLVGLLDRSPMPARASVELRLSVSLAVALVLLDQSESVLRAAEMLTSVDHGADPPGLLAIADRATVYNVASCYALLDRLMVPLFGRSWLAIYLRERPHLSHPHTRALEYLAYAFIVWLGDSS